MVTAEVPTRGRLRLTDVVRRTRSIIARDPFVFAIICAIAFCFYFYALGRAAIWYDEAYSAIYAIQPIQAFWTGFNTGEMNMALYYLILHGWVHVLALFGVTATEWILRLPSAVFSALSAGLVFLLGRRFAGRAAGFAAALIYLFNRYPLYAAHQARSYSLELLLICLSWYALLILLTSKAGMRWWACYIAVSTLAIYAHVLSLLILIAQGAAICLLCIIPNRSQAHTRALVRSFVGAYILIGLLIVPLLSVSGRNPTKTLWIGAPQLVDIPHLYISYMSSGGGVFARLMVSASLFVGLAVWIISRSVSARKLIHSMPVNNGTSQAQRLDLRERIPFAVVLMCWVVIPVLTSYTISRFTTLRMFSDRYLMIIVPALALALGLGISALRWRSARTIVLLGLVAGALVTVPEFYATEQLSDMRTPTNWLVQHYQRGDGLVCHFKGQYAPGCQNLQFDYYLYYYHASDLASYAATQPVSGTPDSSAWAELEAYAAQHPRLFFVAGDVGGEHDIANQRVVQHWLDSHYRLISSASGRGNTVRLYDTSRLSAVGSSPRPNATIASRIAPVCASTEY